MQGTGHLEVCTASKTFSKLGDQVVYFQCDTADDVQVRETLDAISQELRTPDSVCCHADIVHIAGVEEYSLQDFDELMRVNARELASRGIRANAVAPGIVGAGMALKMYKEDADYKARTDRAIPLGYLQPPESVANTFAFLCSDMSDYMTGSVLVVDGGCGLYPNI